MINDVECKFNMQNWISLECKKHIFFHCNQMRKFVQKLQCKCPQACSICLKTRFFWDSSLILATAKRHTALLPFCLLPSKRIVVRNNRLRRRLQDERALNSCGRDSHLFPASRRRKCDLKLSMCEGQR